MLIALLGYLTFWSSTANRSRCSYSLPLGFVRCDAGDTYLCNYREVNSCPAAEKICWEYFTCTKPASGKFALYTYVYFANYPPRTPARTPWRTPLPRTPQLTPNATPSKPLKCLTEKPKRKCQGQYCLSLLALAQYLY